MSAPCWTMHCRESHLRESHLMVSVNLETPPLAITPAVRPPRVWKFWGTTLWGLFVFVAMFAGQMAVIVYLLLRGRLVRRCTATRIVGGGTALASVITSLQRSRSRSGSPSAAPVLVQRYGAAAGWKHMPLGALGSRSS